MKPKKHLCFSSLRKVLSFSLRQLPDSRQKAKIDYTIHDAMMSGFACMFFQDPSLLQFQEILKSKKNRSNLETLFDVKAIPGSSQIRDIIDNVESDKLRPIFKEFFHRLQRGKHLNKFQLFPGLYTCSIDGTQYFSSPNINCSSCLTSKHKDGSVTYSHKMLQAAIMHPDVRQVIPLMPEEIRNTDGNIKQDCEINAAKRLIPKLRKDYPQLGFIITGDDLFSRQPFISTLLSARMHYILAAKATSHPFMMDWIKVYDDAGEMNKTQITDKKSRIHVYEWMNDVPLHGGTDTIKVNFFRYKIISKTAKGNEKITCKRTWITDIEITEENVSTLVRGARCRWKIENECFNTLKNQGYHIEHNYGHGSKNLCYNFLLLTLLAFYFHQIFEHTNTLYQTCRKEYGSKRHLWETLRVYIRLLIFETVAHLFDFALDFDSTKYKVTCRSP
jgi:hypothetical protein